MYFGHFKEMLNVLLELLADSSLICTLLDIVISVNVAMVKRSPAQTDVMKECTELTQISYCLLTNQLTWSPPRRSPYR